MIDSKDLETIVSMGNIPDGLLEDSERINSLYRSIEDLPVTIGQMITWKLQKNPKITFNSCSALAENLQPNETIDPSIIDKMAELAVTPKQISKVLSLASIWYRNERGDYRRIVVDQIDGSKKEQAMWIGAINYCQNMPDGAQIDPCFEEPMIRRVLVTCEENSERIIEFCNSTIATRWKKSTKTAISKMDWPVEIWRAIADVATQRELQKLALEKIENIRRRGVNQKLSQT
jgi:hypothetical protein